jgi:type VI secretion system protein ImpF
VARLLRGAPIPLFERLGLDETSAAQTQFDSVQLEASVGRELARLLNTRSPLTFSGYLESDGTVLEYGVPDFSGLSPKSAVDMRMLEATLLAAVHRYEKRLKGVRAEVTNRANRPGSAIVLLSGEITVGLEVRRVDFEVPVDGIQAGNVKVQAS